jgi:hypothetical protein
MMRAQVFIPGPLPGMNEMIAAAKSGRGKASAYARMKATWTAVVATHARRAFAANYFGRVRVFCAWSEEAMRRDPDNVTAAVKFVLDGLVEAKILHCDRWHCVAGIQHEWEVGAVPGVLVELENA